MKINFTEDMTETEEKAIYSSISTIASTPYGTVPYLRDMGIKNINPDNSDLARNAFSTEVISQASEWEDRVTIESIEFNGNEMEVTLQ